MDFKGIETGTFFHEGSGPILMICKVTTHSPLSN
jgi:hypothetical protein